MAISSTATTDAVTISRVTFAPLNEFAMSAPNAGPPVTWAVNVSGNRSAAELRSDSTASLSAKPDRLASRGSIAMAALAVVGRHHRRWRGGRPDRGQVLGTEHRAVGAGDDEDCRRLVAARELLQRAGGACGFGAGGQELGRLSAGLVGAGEADQRAAEQRDGNRDQPRATSGDHRGKAIPEHRQIISDT